MHLKTFIQVALAGVVTAQSSRSLQDALASQNSSLSVLNGILASQSGLVKGLSNASDITFLAPNNDAMNKFLASPDAKGLANETLIALLTYHVVNGTYYANALATAKETLFVPTLLANSAYTNVTGGQRVGVSPANGSVTVLSGLGAVSKVVTTNVNFTGGTIHIIDEVLNLPTNASSTAVAANLTALAGALKQADLVTTVDYLKDVTIFAPTNEAFEAIGNVFTNLSNDQLSYILKYHVVPGHVVYSPLIQNNSVATAANNVQLKFTVEDGQVFVNSARVIKPNVIVGNGVVHVIDNVLNPKNTTAVPEPTAPTEPPAYSGAGSTTGVPFTAGQTSGPTGPNVTNSTSGAAPKMTGAIGAAALFGGAAMMANM